MNDRRRNTFFVSSFTPCANALSSIGRESFPICRKPRHKGGHLVCMSADNLKFWKDFWCGGFPGGEKYLKEVIQSDFQKPVPGLDSTGVAAQGERQKVENKPSSVKRPSSSYPVANSSSNSDSSKNGVSGGGQVRLVTDPVTGRSRLEIVPDE